MTGTVAYILARKIALGAVSGIKNLSFSGNTIIFNFNDGTSASMVVPLPKDGKDGVSVTNVEINDAKHLICTMSDSSTIDAGEIPGGTGGGLIQVKNKAALPTAGVDNTLYLTKDDDILYYWDDKDKLYRPVTGGSGANGIDFKTSNIEFDSIETTFNLPIDDKKVSVFINGMYLTENEDYTIDRTVTPNTITFSETWEEEDLCTVVWVHGNIDSGDGNKTVYYRDFSTTTRKQLELFAAINLEDLPNQKMDTENPVLVAGGDVYNTLTQNDYPDDKRPYVKTVYILDNNKILGIALAFYKADQAKFELQITAFNGGNSSIDNASLAKKEDIDKLFTNIPDIDTSNSTLATKEDIDNLFQGNETIDPDTSSLATKQDIDKLFS